MVVKWSAEKLAKLTTLFMLYVNSGLATVHLPDIMFLEIVLIHRNSRRESFNIKSATCSQTILSFALLISGSRITKSVLFLVRVFRILLRFFLFINFLIINSPNCYKLFLVRPQLYIYKIKMLIYLEKQFMIIILFLIFFFYHGLYTFFRNKKRIRTRSLVL